MDPRPTLTVKFNCSLCGLRNVAVQVRARTDPYAEDVTHWVKNVVVKAIALRHGQLSLLCEADEIRQLRIPMPPDGWIGAPTDMIPPDIEDESQSEDEDE